MSKIQEERKRLADLWIGSFQQLVPEVSSRVATRLAWRLAGENIATAEQLEQISATDLLRYPEMGQKCVELRDLFLKRHARSNQKVPAERLKIVR